MICIYEANTTSWHGNGLCILQPSSCIVTEIAGGDFSPKLVHPIPDTGIYIVNQEEFLICKSKFQSELEVTRANPTFTKTGNNLCKFFACSSFF